MKSIRDIQDTIIEDSAMIVDDCGKYVHLVGLADQLPKMRQSDKTDLNLVKGCRPLIWLDIRVINGLFYFAADSDTTLIKSILYLLQETLCGQPAREVAEAKLDFLQRTKMITIFKAERQKDAELVIQILQDRARSFLTSRESERRRKNADHVNSRL